MKELSIEEKAKAYDKAKLRMSAAYNNNRCTLGFMNEIFPELVESEDEKIRKAIINEISLLEKESVVEQRKNVYQSWIAWLEKQGEKKPAWSEKDESIRRRCIGAIEMANLSDYTKNDILNWLKSLSPQNRWKPSDEQMNALLWVIENANKSIDINISLNSLYEQLKKLMEE